jgi:putative photosynthetic complex assembly protein
MTDTPSKTEMIHRRGVRAAVALVLFSLAVTVTVVLTGTGERYTPQTAPASIAQLLFEDHEEGVVKVIDADTNRVLVEYAATEGVFVRGIMRTVARQRRIRGLGEGRDVPVELARMEDGQLWLTDPMTEVRFFLGAFGSDNVALFDDILARGEQILSAQADTEAEPIEGEVQ